MDRKVELERRTILDPLVEEVLGDAGVDEDLEVLSGLGEDILGVWVELGILLLLMLTLWLLLLLELLELLLLRLLLLLMLLYKLGHGRGRVAMELVVLRGIHCGCGISSTWKAGRLEAAEMSISGRIAKKAVRVAKQDEATKVVVSRCDKTAQACNDTGDFCGNERQLLDKAIGVESELLFLVAGEAGRGGRESIGEQVEADNGERARLLDDARQAVPVNE